MNSCVIYLYHYCRYEWVEVPWQRFENENILKTMFHSLLRSHNGILLQGLTTLFTLWFLIYFLRFLVYIISLHAVIKFLTCYVFSTVHSTEPIGHLFPCPCWLSDWFCGSKVTHLQYYQHFNHRYGNVIWFHLWSFFNTFLKIHKNL